MRIKDIKGYEGLYKITDNVLIRKLEIRMIMWYDDKTNRRNKGLC